MASSSITEVPCRLWINQDLGEAGVKDLLAGLLLPARGWPGFGVVGIDRLCHYSFRFNIFSVHAKRSPEGYWAVDVCSLDIE